MSIRDSTLDGFTEGWFFRLQVQELIRGPVPPLVEVYTGNDTGRMVLDVGVRYLLFPTLWEGLPVIDKCTNGGPLPSDEWAVQLAKDAVAYCPAYPSVEEEFNESAAVFIGRVLSRQDSVDLAAPGGIAGVLYQVRVTETLRGQPGPAVDLYTRNDAGRLALEIGRNHLFFSKVGEGAHPLINNCGHSGLLVAHPNTLRIVRGLAVTKADK